MGGKSTKVIFQRYSQGYLADTAKVSVPWSTFVEDIPNWFPHSFYKHCPKGFEACYYRNDDDPVNFDDYFGFTLARACNLQGFHDSINPLTFSVRFVPIPRPQAIKVLSPYERSSTELGLVDLMGPIVRSPARPHLSSSSSSSSSPKSVRHHSQGASQSSSSSSSREELPSVQPSRQGDSVPFATAREQCHPNKPREIKVELFLFINNILINTRKVVKDSRNKLYCLNETAQQSFELGFGKIHLVPLNVPGKLDQSRLTLGSLATATSLSVNVIYYPTPSDRIYSHRAYVDAMKINEARPSDDELVAERTIMSTAKPKEYHDRPAKDDEEACTVCMDNVIQICIVPCGHHAFCISCAEKLEICSICRGPIELRQRVFKP